VKLVLPDTVAGLLERRRLARAGRPVPPAVRLVPRRSAYRLNPGLAQILERAKRV